MDKDLLALAEMAADSITKEGHDWDDIYNEAIQAILETESEDLVEIVKHINKRLVNLKPIKKSEAFEKVCYNDAEYNLIKGDITSIFVGQDSQILALMLEGNTPREISEELKIRESLVNLRIYYIRKKIKNEYCDN